VISGVTAKGFEHSPGGAGGEIAGDESFGVAAGVGLGVGVAVEVGVVIAAKPTIAKRPPTKQGAKASKTRGFRKPD